jgi:hypothetical protein
MRLRSVGLVILGAALSATAGLARASECGEQIRLLDDRYSLAVVQTGDHGGEPLTAPGVASGVASGADQTTASGTGGTARSTAGIDSVPNTGGIANPRNTPVNPLDAAQRARLREALLAARRADQAGDGTTCAAKVAEARRVAQGDKGDALSEPRAR